MQKVLAALLAAVVALLGVIVFQNGRERERPPEIGASYQAVVLVGGQVYYGKLENPGGQFPILRDVFYIAAQTDPQTRLTTNTFVRRGKELHGPEYMVLNRSSILFVEPIRDDSQVGK